MNNPFTAQHTRHCAHHQEENKKGQNHKLVYFCEYVYMKKTTIKTTGVSFAQIIHDAVSA